MSEFKDKVKKFYSGEYDSFEDIAKEEKALELKEAASSVSKILDIAIESILDSKVDTIAALNEGYDYFRKFVNESESKKMNALLEGYEKTIALLAVDCDENDLNSCKKCLKVIKENVDLMMPQQEPMSGGEISDEPSTEVEPVVEARGPYESIVFLHGKEASEALNILNNDGEEAAFEFLKQWHNAGDRYQSSDMDVGETDTVREFPAEDGGTYYLVYNTPFEYIGLLYKSVDDLDENVAPAAVTAGSIAIKPDALGTPIASDEEVAKGLQEEHDPIPGVDGNDVGEDLNAVSAEEVIEDPDEMPNPDSFITQHEKVVGGDKVTKGSGYEAGFAEGRKLWKKGSNPKKLAQQLAETEYSDKPYGYVTRFQEGVVAGFAFQEEVIRDTNPDLLEEDDDEIEK